MGTRTKNSFCVLEYTWGVQLFWCNEHLEIAIEKKHEPTKAFCDGVINLRKQIACAKRKHRLANPVGRNSGDGEAEFVRSLRELPPVNLEYPGKREFERGLIIGMKTAGWSTRRVAGQVDRSECAVRNCWEQWTREGTHARKTGSGGTRKTTRREDRRIERQALEDPTVTLSTIRADVGVAIAPQTISRHLAEANLKSKSPFRALPLTPEHQQLRLQWCQARSMWNVTDWQKVVFSDESRFVLGTEDNRVRVCRHPAYDSRSTLIVLRRALTGQRYVDDILRPHTHPLPACSPDLSPVEHVWVQLKRQMPSCHSLHDLELAVQDLWAHLPQDNIRCLINSMPDRVAACFAAGGGPTRY
ncbi:transposable element Tc1 transposase [Trichonephila clavipes]|nr:transposable element Tc1 transposase [Trichonephila clavipes]